MHEIFAVLSIFSYRPLDLLTKTRRQILLSSPIIQRHMIHELRSDKSSLCMIFSSAQKVPRKKVGIS